MVLRVAFKFWFPVMVWMGLIFSASTDLGSSQHTSRFIGPFLRFFKPDIRLETVELCQRVARKGAHFTEYAILALLLVRARECKPLWPARIRPVAVLRFSLVMAALYASTDEFHQLFVSSRESSVLDVFLDTLGSLAGLGLLQLHSCWFGPARAGRL